MLFPITKGEGKWPSRLLPMAWRTNSRQEHLLPAPVHRIGGKGKGIWVFFSNGKYVRVSVYVCEGGGLHRCLNAEVLWCLEFNLGLWGQRKGRTRRKELNPSHLLALWDGHAAVKEKVSVTAGCLDVNLSTTLTALANWTSQSKILLVSKFDTKWTFMFPFTLLLPEVWHPYPQKGFRKEDSTQSVLLRVGKGVMGGILVGRLGLFNPQEQSPPLHLYAPPHTHTSSHPTLLLPPSFLSPTLRSSLFCHPAIPLCLAHTMGAPCSASWRCILPAHWGASWRRGPTDLQGGQ